MGKTNPLNDNDLKEFVTLQKTFVDSDKSWSIDISELDDSFDLNVKNPNVEDEDPLREPADIIEEIIALDKESEVILANIKGLL
jgi:type I restriction enzyme M protein